MINIFVLVTILGHLPVILSAKSKGSEDMKQILIVEDDSFLNKMLDYNLTADGYGVTSALNARTAAEAMELQLQELNKQYGTKCAVNNVSATLTSGVYGLLGANGAGKTTLMRMICGVLKPTSGSIRLNGKSIGELGERYYTHLGYMPQDFGFYPDFTAREFMMYMAAVKGLDKRQAVSRTEDLLNMVNLKDVADKKIKSYSGGMKQRLGIAQAELNNPSILILDEPTAGLDPKERISIRNYIAELSKDKIILFATHVVSDIECIADKVLLLKSGEIIATGTPVELIESMAGKVGEITCTLDEVGELQKEYKIGNIRQRKNGLALRVVGDELPEEAVKVGDNIDLEDVYLYYFE